VSKLKYVVIIPKPTIIQDVCLTCPMEKFPKLPNNLSEKHVATPFELVYVNIWDAYRVLAYEKFIYFLTTFYHHTRATRVYLLQSKSQALFIIQKFFCSYVKIILEDQY